MVRMFRAGKVIRCLGGLLLVMVLLEFFNMTETLNSAFSVSKRFRYVDEHGRINVHIYPLTIATQSTAKNSTDENKSFVKVKDSGVYLYSAIGLEIDENDNNSNTRKDKHLPIGSNFKIVMSGWENKTINQTVFTCCFKLNNGSILTGKHLSKKHWAYLGKAPLQAKQYVCPLVVDKSLVKGISITYNDNICANTDEKYVKIFFPPKQNKTSIAICSKLAYGNLDAGKLLEWFEVHRLFGVSKVLAYLYKLNSEARKVFEYYESLGMAELVDFDLPEKDKVPRDVGIKNFQSWNDEQIVAYDCQLRLHGYTYVAVMDTDEYMVPKVKGFKNAWIKYLTGIFNKIPTMAGVVFMVKVHATTWGPSDTSSSMLIGRYLNSTAPMIDRMKNVYMPSRTLLGSVSTHTFGPSKGFKKHFASPAEATLHHFRTCRKEWMRKTRKNKKTKDPVERLRRAHVLQFKHNQKCYDLQRYQQPVMAQIATIVEPGVVKIRNQLNLRSTSGQQKTV